LLKEEVKSLTDAFKKERDRHKRTALVFRILSVILAASITILLGLKVAAEIEMFLKNLALAFGAIITVVSAYEAFFSPRALWIRETITYSRLKDLQRDIKLTCDESNEVSREEFENLKKRLDDILQDDLKEWIKLRALNEGASDFNKPV